MNQSLAPNPLNPVSVVDHVPFTVTVPFARFPWLQPVPNPSVKKVTTAPDASVTSTS